MSMIGRYLQLYYRRRCSLLSELHGMCQSRQGTIITTSISVFAVHFLAICHNVVHRWLVSQNKMEKAGKIIGKFERINKKSIPTEVYKQFTETCDRQNEALKDKTYSLIDLFKTPRLRKTALLTIVIYMGSSLVYDGYIRSITTIGFNTFVAFTLASATEFPASFILTFILDKWGRRWLLFGTMGLCAVCSFALSFTINMGNGN